MPTSAPYCITVLTRYHSPTDSRGARISARVVGGQRPACRATRAYDYGDEPVATQHQAAALACIGTYCQARKREPEMIAFGDAPDDRGYVCLFKLFP